MATGDAKPVSGSHHVTLEGVPGADALLFFSVETPTLSLENTQFKTYDGGTDVVNSARGGRQVTVGPLTLQRGVDDDKQVYEWFDKTVKEGVEATKTDLVITVTNAAGTEIEKWNLTGCVPTQYSHSGHNAGDNAVLVASVTIQPETAELA